MKLKEHIAYWKNEFSIVKESVKFQEKVLKKLDKDFGNLRMDLSDRAGASIESLDYSKADINIGVSTKAERLRLKAASKEPWTVKWIEAYVKGKDVFYDVGANIGAYSFIAAKLSERTQVFAFEPSYLNYHSLCNNVVLNNLVQRVKPLQVALFSETRLGTLNLRMLNPGAALHRLDDADSVAQEMEIAFEQPVLVYRLSDLVDTFNLPYPNHLKIDVDGPELNVLHGASEVFSKGDVKSLMIEMDHSKLDKIVEFLHGYDLTMTQAFSRGSEYPVYGLFTKRGVKSVTLKVSSDLIYSSDQN